MHHPPNTAGTFIGIGEIAAMLRRNHVSSAVLLSVAWILYGVSLFLPAAELPGGLSGSHRELVPGWGILLLLLYPFFWPMVFPFVYLLVNVGFWLSPLLVLLRRDGTLHLPKVYAIAMAVASLAAWSALADLPAVGSGGLLWALAVTLAAAAFWVPLKPQPAETVPAG